MNVIGFDLFKNEEFLLSQPQMAFTDNIDDIYNNADVISLHIPHTPASEKMINKKVIDDKFLKKPIIINTSRGALINIDDVIEGLKNRSIRGYLTDVLLQEPMLENEKLKGLENVIITPHVGSRTFQSVVRQGTMSVENLIKISS